MNIIKKKICGWLLRLRPAFLAEFIKRIAFIKRERLKTEYGIFYVDPGSSFGQTLTVNGIYEPLTTQDVTKYLKPGNVFVDVGAHEGYFSVIASNIIGDKGRVFLIEPQYRLKSVIEENLRLNNCKNVTILNLAVMDKIQETVLYLNPTMNTGASSLMPLTNFLLPKQKAQGVTLLEIFKQWGISECHLLKMDIEGGEYGAILGSAELFKKHHIKTAIIESHPEIFKKQGFPPEGIRDFLLSYGYDSSNGRIFFCKT